MKLITVTRYAYGGWVRIGRHGPGVWWNTGSPTFSERVGARRPVIRLGALRVFRLERIAK